MQDGRDAYWFSRKSDIKSLSNVHDLRRLTFDEFIWYLDTGLRAKRNLESKIAKKKAWEILLQTVWPTCGTSWPLSEHSAISFTNRCLTDFLSELLYLKFKNQDKKADCPLINNQCPKIKISTIASRDTRGGSQFVSYIWNYRLSELKSEIPPGRNESRPNYTGEENVGKMKRKRVKGTVWGAEWGVKKGARGERGRPRKRPSW